MSACRSGKHLIERRDTEAGHTQAVLRGKNLRLEPGNRRASSFLGATTSAKAVHE